MSRYIPKIIVTSGEPAGIGPDVCLHLLNAKLPAHISILGDSVVFSQRAEQLGLQNALQHLNLISVPTRYPVQAGRLNIENVPMVINQLDLAITGCIRKKYAAMVTAPLHKGIINDAGIKFSGHTEYLAKKTQAEKPVMLLACDAMRVALVTTHLALQDVPKAITQEKVLRTLETLYNDLRLRFGINSPKIAVCGLNPHAGEQGHMGREEIEVIEPSLVLARNSGYDILGPLPADTAFTPRILEQVDAVLCMYHDQGLPVLKYASFGKGVNITLGLPIIRTSVDHGTALDLAGTGRIESGSMIAAVESAIELAHIAHTRKKIHKKVSLSKNAVQTPAPSVAVSPAPSVAVSPAPSVAVSPATSVGVSPDLSEKEFSEIFQEENLELQTKPKNEKPKVSKNLPETLAPKEKSQPEIDVAPQKKSQPEIDVALKEKGQPEMDMESTSTSTVDKTVKSMKMVLT